MSRATLAPGAMPVTARVVGDLLMRAGRTAQYMTTECRTAAGLDRRHHLELAEADVPRMRLTPYLVPWARKISATSRACRDMIRLCGYRQNLQRTGHFLQYIGGDLGIEAGGLQLAVTEQYLDQADIDFLFQ